MTAVRETGAGDDPVEHVARALDSSSGPVFVGFSGGLDSTVLLDAAARVAQCRPELTLVAVHVNHGIQQDADAWQAHCGRVAASLGVGFAAHRVHVVRRGSLEAAARSARYVVFARHLETPGARLLLAHHRDDQAETVLLRLLQGRGLYGMPAVRRLGAGSIVRPLLGLTRAALERHARRHALEWREDPSNADPALDRNYVRHVLLPVLRARFPTVDGALLNAMAARQAEDALLLESTAQPLERTFVPIAWLLDHAPVQQVAWLRLWLAAHGRATPSGRALRTLLGQLAADADRQPRLALDRGELRRYRDRLWLVAPAPTLALRYAVAAPGRLQLPHGLLEVTEHPAGFACRGSLEVRFRAGGERIRAGGHQRMVKHLFQAAGVPPWARRNYPLVCDDEGLAAVPDIAERDAETDGSGWTGVRRLRVSWRPAVPFR